MASRHHAGFSEPLADEFGRTPLHYAALANDLQRLQNLLASGANPNAADKDGWTPLHFAAQSNASSSIRALLAAGALVDTEDSHGNTALWRAVFSFRSHGETIRLLRAAGANPRKPNHAGVSALGLARTIANHPVAEYFSDLSAEV